MAAPQGGRTRPRISGSIALNGATVAEQIGAQIFIDAFGMVAPGKPELAAELARRSASVSHDGEAVNGAVVVAAMVSAAFVEKDMDRLLDTAVGVIPEDSIIARVHRDVRAWVRKDRDWRKTYKRIARKYGYCKYGGGCHMIPNHAVMVMAWAYAPDDFYESQVIINTAGWDTDCNAANVGSVMGVKVGLAGHKRAHTTSSPPSPTASSCRPRRGPAARRTRSPRRSTSLGWAGASWAGRTRARRRAARGTTSKCPARSTAT